MLHSKNASQTSALAPDVRFGGNYANNGGSGSLSPTPAGIPSADALMFPLTRKVSKKALRNRSKLHHNSDDLSDSWISKKMGQSAEDMIVSSSSIASSPVSPADYSATPTNRRSMSPLRNSLVRNIDHTAHVSTIPSSRRSTTSSSSVDNNVTATTDDTTATLSTTGRNTAAAQSRLIYQESIHSIMTNSKHHVLYAAVMLGRFDKMSEDELQLEEDAIVYVIRECDDLWLLGVTTQGEIGFFGENFCRRLPGIPPVLDPRVDKMLIFEHEIQQASELIWRTWKHYKEKKIMKKKLRKIYLRRFILKEWVEQEQGNLRDFQILKNLFYNPLKDASHILKREHFNEMFDGFPEMYETGASFSKALIALAGREHDMLNLFNRRCEEFKSFLTFVVKLDSSIQHISDNKEKNANFREFVKNQRKNPDSKNRTLLDLQTKPFKSLIHRQNIIVRLHKDTPPESPNYQVLSEAQANIIAVINFINDTKRSIQDRISMKNLQDEIHNFEVVKAWRYPVISGILNIQTARSSHSRSLKAHLMNDVFLFVKKQKLHIFYLVFTKLQVDMNDSNNLLMHLDNGLTYVDIKFKSSAEKTRWVQAFAECYGSEKEYAKENNIFSSINQMFHSYRHTIKEVADLSKKMDRKCEIYRYYRKRMDEATGNIEAKRKQFVAYVSDQQAQRKAMSLQAQEGRKDHEILKRERSNQINSALESLEQFKIIMRRDEKNFSELFGPGLTQLEQWKQEQNELLVHRNAQQVFSKFRAEQSLDYDPELEVLGDAHNVEMENVRQLVKALDSHEQSFMMMTSAAELQANLHTASEQINMMRNKNRELKGEVERLHRVADTASKELLLVASEPQKDTLKQVQKATQLIDQLQNSADKKSMQERILELENERDFYKSRMTEQESRSNDLMTMVNDLRSKSTDTTNSQHSPEDNVLKRKRHLEEQNHRLQEEILHLQTALTESRKEKTCIIQESRHRGRTLLQAHSELLREREEFVRLLATEREKSQRLHGIIHNLHQSNLQSTKRSWISETALDIQRSNTEELRIEALKSYYHIAFLEKEVLATKKDDTSRKKRLTIG